MRQLAPERRAALASLEVVLDRRLGVLERRYAESLDAPVRAAYRARLMSLDDAALAERIRAHLRLKGPDHGYFEKTQKTLAGGNARPFEQQGIH